MEILKQNHAESFLTLAQKGQEIGNRVCHILTDIDAVRSVNNIKVEEDKNHLSSSIDQRMVKSAIYSVQFAEAAVFELMEVVAKRKMQMTQEYRHLESQTKQVGSRLYRNLWELTLTDGDKKLLNKLIKRIAIVSVWEDLPATLNGLSYDRVKNDMSGTIAYQHAYGVTFVAYEVGKASNGWTVLRDTLEDTLTLARTELDYAVSLLTPTV
jgi:hypothetical protein